MKRFTYRIKFPRTEPHALSQDEAYFLLEEKGEELKIRFHDYGEIYKRKGLYEQLYYDRLKCVSPKRVSEILEKVLLENHLPISELRVLDLGAGNGMVGEELFRHGVARIVGIDISPEAYQACERDRMGIYDAYHVVDLAQLDEATKYELETWQFNCMTTVAALGFGDIPPAAFANGYNLIQKGGWLGFNIKETFMQSADQSGFSALIKDLIFSDILEIHHLERYQHRISIDGKPLFYYAVIGKKEKDIPEDILQKSRPTEISPE